MEMKSSNPDVVSAFERYDPSVEFDITIGLARYAEVKQAAVDAALLVERCNEAIAAINEGLPGGVKVVTETRAFDKVDKLGQLNDEPGSNIYVKTGELTYAKSGRIFTSGKTYPFLGDKLVPGENGELVVINTELGIGLAAQIGVYAIDTNNDPYENTLGGTHIERHEELVSLIKQVPQGEYKWFDLMYY